jgi:hypothetical protein
MKTQKTISSKSTKGFFPLVVIILFLTILSFSLNAQTIVVDPANTNIFNFGEGSADNFDNGSPPSVAGNNLTAFFSTNANGFDYFAWGHFSASDRENNTYARFNNDSYVRIKGDSSGLMQIDWQNFSKVSACVEVGYTANTSNNLVFSIEIFVAPGGGYSIGDPINVYYNYEICGSGLTKHEAGNEDTVYCNNTFLINGIDEIANTFNFNNPPPLPFTIPNIFNWKISYDTISVLVGDRFTIKVTSNITDKIDLPPKVPWPYKQDRASAHFWGKIQLGVDPVIINPINPVINSRAEFSLDIGSDAERSDPFADGDEVFDPGDAYVLGGPALSPLGQNGIKDDQVLFAFDPEPVPGDATTAAPCGSGQPLNPLAYFDLDGMDNTCISILEFNYGPGMPSVQKYNDILIHQANYFLISYDDDASGNYTYTWGSVPVNSLSPFRMDTYGRANEADEVVAVDFDAFNIPSPGFSLDSLWDEAHVHTSMAPNPDNNTEDDNDVDALDFIADEDLQSVYYFSPDHEATGTDPVNGNVLKGGSIYTNGLAGFVEVVNCATHLGLNDATDIDAFEFGWLWDAGAGRLGLALLFSVDDDDWLTTGDESGGLDPAMIYYSFLNGWYAEFSSFPLDDDVDAITICNHSFHHVNIACNTPNNLSASIVSNTAVELSWFPGGTETSWNIEFGPTGFSLGNGTIISGVGNPYLLTGLTSNFDYDFYVQADCGGGSVSSWAGPSNFTTLSCLSFSLPFYEDFTSCTFPVCWTETSNVSPGLWNVANSDLAGGQPCEMKIQWTNGNGTTRLISPPLNTTGASNVKLQFLTFFDDYAPGAYLIIQSSADGITWTDENWSYSSGSGDLPSGTLIDIPIQNNLGSSTYIALVIEGDHYQFDYWHVDNVKVYEDQTCQTLNIPQGWSGVSTWLQPQPPDVVSMFAPIVNDLVILMSQAGYYWPATNTNTIGNWNAYEGYTIKVLNDVTLQVCGTPVTSTSITLAQGWNLVPVLSSLNVDVVTPLGTLPCFVLAKGIGYNTGVAWKGSGTWLYNNLFNLEPGQAYWVYVTCDCTFTFPSSPMKASTSTPATFPLVQSPWNEAARTSVSHLIGISDVFAEQYNGKIIGVFNNAGLCSGLMEIYKENNVLIVYGDDPTTTEIDGMAEGGEMNFKIYDPESDTEKTFEPEFDTSLPDWIKKFKTNGLSRIDLKTSINEVASGMEISVYPNPAKDVVHVRVSGYNSPEMEVRIIDVTGRLMLMDTYPTENETAIDVSTLKKGIYQMIVKFPEGSKTQKLVIN